jgi:hypothetical protein
MCDNDKVVDSEYFDDNDDDASSVEVALKPRPNGRSRLRSAAAVIGAVVLSALLLLLLWGAVHASGSSSRTGPRNSRELLPTGEPSLTSNATKPADECTIVGTRTVTFGRQKIYTDRTQAGDRAWEDLMPSQPPSHLASHDPNTDHEATVGRGNILIENPRQYADLGRGVPQSDLNLEAYGITVFHQLHCLAELRYALHSLQEGEDQYKTPPAHLDHCLDYIRESLMCNGDATIETPSRIEREADRFVGGIDGSNVKHTCRDWGAIVAFAVEHRSSNHTGNFNPKTHVHPGS